MPRPLSELSDAELKAVASGFPALDQLDDNQLAAVAVQQGLMQEDEASAAVHARKAAQRQAELDQYLPAMPTREELLSMNGEDQQTALAAREGTRAVLTKGGKVGDVAAGVILPLAGSVMGAPGGLPGVAAGGAAGGAAGEGLVQLRQYLRGERDEPSVGRLVASTAASAVPVGGQLLKSPVRTVLTRGAQGAGIATVADAAGQLIDDGKIDLASLAASGALGFLFGSGAGAAESFQVRKAVLQQIRRTPEFAGFEGSDKELVAAVRTKMAAEPASPEPVNVTPEPVLEKPALPAGEELLQRAEDSGVTPPPENPAPVVEPAPAVVPSVEPVKPLTDLTDDELLAVAKQPDVQATAIVEPSVQTHLEVKGAKAKGMPLFKLETAQNQAGEYTFRYDINIGNEGVGRPWDPNSYPTAEAALEAGRADAAQWLSRREGKEADKVTAALGRLTPATPAPQLPAEPAPGVEVPSAGSAPEGGGQADEIMPAPVGTVKRGKMRSVGMAPDGSPDLLSEIEELGGIAGHGGSKGGEYDGHGEVFNAGIARLLRRKDASAPDQLVQELNGTGRHNFQSVDEFYQAVGQAATQRKKLTGELRQLEHEGKMGTALLDNTGRKAVLKAKKPVNADSLQVGDAFEVRGEPVKVIGIHPDTGAVTVQNGAKLEIPAGTDLYPDKGKVKKARSKQPSVDPFEDATPYVQAHTRLQQLRALEKQGQLDAGGQAELDQVERTVGQDFLDFYTAEKTGTPTSLADESALQRAELKRQADARLTADDLQSQVDLFGPSTDKAGQFSLFEATTARYLDERQVQNPVSRAAIRGILSSVWERRLARQLELDLATDTAIADTVDPTQGRVDNLQPAGPANGVVGGLDALPNAKLGRHAGGLQVDARRYTQEFLASGFLAHTGRKFESEAQLISAAQVLRNRNVETIWLLPYDAEGRLLAPLAFSSHLPNTVHLGQSWTDRARVLLQRAGAKSYDVMHNHPSGDPAPSMADRAFTRGLSEAIPGLGKHFVINHGSYTAIYPSGDKSEFGIVPEIHYKPDPTAQPQGVSPYLGRKMLSDLAAINLGYELQFSPGNVTIFFLDHRLSINATGSVSEGDIMAPEFARNLADLSAGVGAVRVIAYYHGTEAVNRRLFELKATGVLVDALTVLPTGGVVSIPVPHEMRTGATLHDRNKLASRVAEDEEEYGESDLAAEDGESGEVVPLSLAQMDKVKAVEMPELVQIVAELSGQLPKTKNLTTRGGYMRGEGKGIVVLNKKLFSDPIYMAQILAHELGHLVDYLPQQSLKRGNLLGRLASLRSHLTNTFGGAVANNKELRAELLALDQWWMPWDEASAKDWYKAYRHSAVELYAQALSVLFNAPHELKARAPKFWNEFFRFVDRKPEVKTELFDTWDMIHRGAQAVSADRLQHLRTGFARAEEILLAKADERAGRRNSLEATLENWKQKHFDLYAPIIDKARLAKQRGAALPWHQDPEYVFDAHPLAENANYRFLDRVQKKVLNPLAQAGLDDSYLGDFLFYNRVLHEAYDVGGHTDDEGVYHPKIEGRKTIANPLGHTPATARRELLTMRYKIGPARMDLLKGAARQFQDLVFEVVERGAGAGLFSPESFHRAKLNRYNYAAFAVVDFLEASPHIPAAIRHQSGTLRQIASPFTATVLKMLTTNKLAEHNQAKRVALQLLTRHFPGEALRAEMSKIPLANGKMMYRAKPAPDGKLELMALVDGKPVVWHVDRPIAQMFEMRNPASSHVVVGVLNWTFRNFFYPLFLTYNPAFQLYLNPIRDLRRSYVNLPAGVKRRHYIGEQIRKNVTARARMMNDVGQADLVRRRTLRALQKQRPLTPDEAHELKTLDLRALSIELLATRALSTPFESFAHNPTRSDVWGRMLQDYKLMPEDGKASFVREYIFGKLGLGKAVDKLDSAGMIMEAMPKAGAYHVLTRELGWKAGAAAQFVRNHVGTPNHLRRGQWASMDGTIFPFINIFMQGMAGDLQQATGQALGPVDPRKQRFEWWRRMAESTLVPRLLQALAAAGVLGAGLKKYYDGVSEYNKTNYLVLPLGKVSSGDYGYKTVALRLPEDETARVLGGLVHYTVQLAANDDPAAKTSVADLVNVMGGNVPGVNPIITMADGWRHYAAGVNPRDGLRGNTIMSSTQFNAGGWPRLEGMFAWSWEQTGGANFVRWDRNANTTSEMVLGATPLLNRALLITDGGLREQQEQANILFDQRNAQIRAALPDNVNRLLAEYNRLMSLRPETRTLPQQFRLKELSLWNNKIWGPNYRQMQETDRTDWKSLGQAVGDMSQPFEKQQP